MTTKNEEKVHWAFDLVANQDDWKAPIDAYITSDQIKPVYEAICYMTATMPAFEYIGIMNSKLFGVTAFEKFAPGDHIVRVRAAGYRNGPAGDC